MFPRATRDGHGFARVSAADQVERRHDGWAEGWVGQPYGMQAIDIAIMVADAISAFMLLGKTERLALKAAETLGT